ncbi:MAG: M48 family metallopeptidase [Myxococcales bacterium]|nr:M48 family metallopeptidase [Myxococcales bacterium]
MLNIYAIIVLATLLGSYLLSTVADLLNLRAMAPELPAEFDDVYDADSYRRSQQYTRVRSRFALWPRSFNLLLLLGFWFGGGFEWLDSQLRALGLAPLLTGLLFIAALMGGQLLLNLPFQLYGTFVIEERFGFNRTTAKTFVGDRLKGLLLAVALGGPVGALILTLFEQAGELAWLYCWLASTALILLLQFVAPSWLMPIFLKFTPLEDGELRQRILDYARAVDFPVDNLFVVDGSRRSSKANAFFTGFGRHRRIGLFDTLIDRHSPEELLAIVAHEVGHYKKRHVIQGMVVSILHLGILLFVFGYLMGQPALYAAFGMEHSSVYAGLVFCSLLYQPVELMLSLWMLSRSRKHEFEADRFAVETTGLGEALVQGLKKLSRDSLGNLTPHPGYVLLHYSHPPMLQRIGAIRQVAVAGSVAGSMAGSTAGSVAGSTAG